MGGDSVDTQAGQAAKPPQEILTRYLALTCA